MLSPFYSVLGAHTIRVHPDKLKRNTRILCHRHKLARWFAHMRLACLARRGKYSQLLELRLELERSFASC
jgi:hypothetical protein